MPLTFHCLDALTHGPKPPNEDAHGVSPAAAWVIDGATGVNRGADILEPSGAAWLARTLSETLSAVLSESGPPSLADTLAAAETKVSGAFERAVGDQPIEAPDLPTACLGLALLHEGRLHLAAIGDISILHRRGDGTVTLLSDHAIEAVASRTQAAFAEARRLRPHEDPWPLVRETIRENRLLANQPGGYNVVHPRVPWRSLVVTANHAVDPGDVLLLLTDGFYRLIDHFGIHTQADLVEAALADGLQPLIARLRAEEEADPHGVRAPRIKKHDDATAILVRVVDGDDNTN
jgi:serine/threonine protein phosphatase PrpC